MNDPSRQRNLGTGLLGPNFARRNRPRPTTKTENPGQWVALDESGWDGDQLYGRPRSRYLSIGTVAISDDEAAPIAEEIRTATRLQAAEVKFSKAFTGLRNGPRRSVPAKMLAPGGVLHDRA